MNNQFTLMKDRRFWPLFYTQFLGAFNDNLFKTCVAVIVAYGLWDIGDWRPEIVVSLATAIFIAPFVFFAPLAGDLADKYDKSTIIRWVKIAEIFIVVCAIMGLIMQSVPFVLLATFALGAQSAFFSPCKFSILPQHLNEDELIGGNALLSTGTYLAILAGTILAGLWAISTFGLFMASIVLIVCALIGYGTARYIPKAPPKAPTLKLNFNTPVEAVKIIRYAAAQPQGVFTAIIGGAWFYFVAATLLSQFPNFAKLTLGVDNVVLTFFMTVFSIGIAIGGLLNNQLLRAEIKATFVPFAMLGVSVFAIDLYWASLSFQKTEELIGFMAFIADPKAWRIIADLLFLSIFGGLFVVPLRSIVQHRTAPDHRARVIASSNLLEALFMLISALIATAFLSLGFAVEQLFLMLGLVNIGVALYITKLVPDHSFRETFALFFKRLYICCTFKEDLK